jgi:hypothetical protein
MSFCLVSETTWLTPNAWICMKIHGGDAPKICQYNPILVKTGQK